MLFSCSCGFPFTSQSHASRRNDYCKLSLGVSEWVCMVLCMDWDLGVFSHRIPSIPTAEIHHKPNKVVTEDECMNKWLWFGVICLGNLEYAHSEHHKMLTLVFFLKSGAVQWCELHYALPCTCSTQSGSVWLQHAGTNWGQTIRFFFFLLPHHTKI